MSQPAGEKLLTPSVSSHLIAVDFYEPLFRSSKNGIRQWVFLCVQLTRFANVHVAQHSNPHFWWTVFLFRLHFTAMMQFWNGKKIDFFYEEIFQYSSLHHHHRVPLVSGWRSVSDQTVMIATYAPSTRNNQLRTNDDVDNEQTRASILPHCLKLRI